MGKYNLISGFSEFISALKSELASLTKADNFSGISDLEEIIIAIEEMQNTELIPSVQSSLNLGIQEISTAFHAIFDPVRSKFSTERDFLIYLKDSSGEFFSFKKSFQLSHARGLWKNWFQAGSAHQEAMKNYFLSRLYIDYFESFPLLFNPFIKNHPTLILNFPSKGSRSDTALKYLHLYSITSTQIFNNISDKNDLYIKFRNAHSHANFLYDDNEVFELNKSGVPELRKSEEVLQTFQNMMDIHVIFATELDINLLKIAMNKIPDTFKPWMEYFSTYVDWFLKIAP